MSNYDPVRRAWIAMKARCLDPDHPRYFRYGGRGIKVCQRWQKSFENFKIDVGPRPSQRLTLEREDNDGDYKPNNVVWATRKQQARNRSNNIRLKAFGKDLTVAEWLEHVDVPRSSIYKRIAAGWSSEKVLTFPARSNTFKRIRVGRRSLTVPEWSRLTGIKSITIRMRLEHGWSARDAVFTRPS